MVRDPWPGKRAIQHVFWPEGHSRLLLCELLCERERPKLGRMRCMVLSRADEATGTVQGSGAQLMVQVLGA